MMMTDLRHYLNEEGTLEGLPGPALDLVLFLGSIVSWMTRFKPQEFERTNVHCEQRVKKTRCGGDIFACFEGESISWHCIVCSYGGVIRGWQKSFCDRSADSRLVVENKSDRSNVVPKALRSKFEAIVALTDQACKDLLNDEFSGPSRKLTAFLSRLRPSPLQNGPAKSWAGGVLYALGQVNFLFNEHSEPSMKFAALCQHFGVSQQTVTDKARVIIERADLYPTHPEYTIPTKQNVAVLESLLSSVAANDIQSFAKTFIDKGPLHALPDALKDQFIAGLLEGEASLNEGEEGDDFLPLLPKSPTPILQIKVTLKHIRPPIWRRLLVDHSVTLEEFHDILQAVMGWTDSHLHSFESPDGRRFTSLEDDMMGWADEATMPLGAILEVVGDKLLYEYDFGDGWEHSIVLEKRLTPSETPHSLPHCIKGKRACPLEDSGGAWGHAEIVDHLKGKMTPRGEDLVDWIPTDYDPEHFDLNEKNAALKKIPSSGFESIVLPLGKRPPRYQFLLNPYENMGFTRCFECSEKTKVRQIVFFVNMRNFGPFAAKLACKLCTHCEIIIAHQDKFEDALSEITNDSEEAYSVIGTIQGSRWKRAPTGKDFVNHVVDDLADFQQHVQIKVEGGWGYH